MNKFRNAIEEGKFAARVARQFFRSYRKWRDANPDEDVVYVYVGHPDMAATIVKQSPLWQQYAKWERLQTQATAFDAGAMSPQTVYDNIRAAQAGHPRLRTVECDCAACTASRATREESKPYDA